jgi:hypothetical protein
VTDSELDLFHFEKYLSGESASRNTYVEIGKITPEQAMRETCRSEAILT